MRFLRENLTVENRGILANMNKLSCKCLTKLRICGIIVAKVREPE